MGRHKKNPCEGCIEFLQTCRWGGFMDYDKPECYNARKELFEEYISWREKQKDRAIPYITFREWISKYKKHE